MKRTTAKLGIALLSLLIFTSAGMVFAQDFYVQQNVGSDSNPGDAWGEGHALATIQRAIDLAETTSEGDTVHVAAASYNEHINIYGYSDITLYGGYPSNGGTVRNPVTNITTIDGGNSGRVVTIVNASNIVVDGFVVQNGDVTNVGGGIAIDDCSAVTIQNNIVMHNIARGDWGGGIAVIQSNVTITGNTIQNNQSSGSNGCGGGISFFQECSGTVTGNIITHNTASIDGGGMMIYSANLSILSNRIDNNTAADGSGGGLVIERCNSMTVTGNTISNNVLSGTGSFLGAGIRCIYSNAQIRRNFIQDNRGATWGGGINLYSSDAFIVNNLISGNQALNGGGIYFAQASSAQIHSSTIAGNTADSGAGIYVESSCHVTATNSIVWANNTQQIGGDGIFTATYCDIQGGYSGTGNLNSDPLFVGGDDYQLTSSSPCIDAGTSTDAPATDIVGTIRPQGSGYDMGAYEYIGPPSLDIKANSQDGPLIVTPNDSVSVTISLDAGDKAGHNADWWIVVRTLFASPGDWFSYVYPTGWQSGIHVCIQMPLFNLSSLQVFNMSLPVGSYTFYFAVDDADGSPLGPWWGMDSVEVTVKD